MNLPGVRLCALLALLSGVACAGGLSFSARTTALGGAGFGGTDLLSAWDDPSNLAFLRSGPWLALGVVDRRMGPSSRRPYDDRETFAPYRSAHRGTLTTSAGSRLGEHAAIAAFTDASYYYGYERKSFIEYSGGQYIWRETNGAPRAIDQGSSVGAAAALHLDWFGFGCSVKGLPRHPYFVGGGYDPGWSSSAADYTDMVAATARTRWIDVGVEFVDLSHGPDVEWFISTSVHDPERRIAAILRFVEAPFGSWYQYVGGNEWFIQGGLEWLHAVPGLTLRTGGSVDRVVFERSSPWGPSFRWWTVSAGLALDRKPGSLEYAVSYDPVQRAHAVYTITHHVTLTLKLSAWWAPAELD